MDIWLKPQENFVIPTKRAKREAAQVTFATLKPQQEAARAEIFKYLEADKSGFLYYTLNGYAGTGKTYLISRIIEWLIYNKNYKIAVTAPTNKAVRILRDMSDIHSKRLDFKTLHSLLGLKMRRDNNGGMIFQAAKNFDADLCKYNLIVIDEVSMLNVILFEKINEFISRPNCQTKVVFLGDPAQIPPVDFNEAVPFQKYFRDKYRIGESVMTDIQRQAHDNPILDFATHIREHRTTDFDLYDYKVKFFNGGGIIPIGKHQQDFIYQICKNYFVTDIYKEYPDFMKVVAYRNITVAAINRRVRSFIFGREDLPKVMIGEKLMADSPIIDYTSPFKEILYPTNAEIEILEAEVKETKSKVKLTDGFTVEHPLKYYECRVRDCNELDARTQFIRIIHEDSDQVYNAMVNNLTDRINRMAYDYKAQNWAIFFGFKEVWADVDYNYAITAHKSQGSTYENCMMLNWDMKLNTRYEERNRIRYVAASRAKSRLFIIN